MNHFWTDEDPIDEYRSGGDTEHVFISTSREVASENQDKPNCERSTRSSTRMALEKENIDPKDSKVVKEDVKECPSEEVVNETDSAPEDIKVSNTHKYFEEYTNFRSGPILKRRCNICRRTFRDIRGFNRHFEMDHLN